MKYSMSLCNKPKWFQIADQALDTVKKTVRAAGELERRFLIKAKRNIKEISFWKETRKVDMSINLWWVGERNLRELLILAVSTESSNNFVDRDQIIFSYVVCEYLLKNQH